MVGIASRYFAGRVALATVAAVVLGVATGMDGTGNQLLGNPKRFLLKRLILGHFPDQSPTFSQLCADGFCEERHTLCTGRARKPGERPRSTRIRHQANARERLKK